MIEFARSTWTNLPARATAAVLTLGGFWLLLRAFVLDSYSITEFAEQSGTISILAGLTMLARLGRRVTEPTPPPDFGRPFSPFDRARIAGSLTLLLGTFACLLWWVVRIAHGMYLKRLQFGIDPNTRFFLGLWACSLVVCPRPPQRLEPTRRRRFHLGCEITSLAILICTYPYTDPFEKYVQWSGLYLPVVAALAIWNLVALIRGESFVGGLLDELATRLVPHDVGIARLEKSADGSIARWSLTFICAAAMAMQAINVTWGLPINQTDREPRPIHPDEKVTYEQAWRLYVDPEPVAFVWGGSAYFRIGMILKELATYFTDPEFTVRFQILLLRWLNVLAVGGTVWLAHEAGQELFDRPTALIAAILMAVLPGNVVTAQPARPEAIFTLLCTASLYASIRAAKGSATNPWLRVAGFLMGAGIATKVTGVALAGPLAVVIARRSTSPREFALRSVEFALTAGLGYFLASFESFFFPDRFIEAVTLSHTLHAANDWNDLWQSIATVLGPISSFAWTVPGYLLLLLGVLIAGRRRDQEPIIAFLVFGHLISFVQRDSNLRSHVHMSCAVALVAAHVWFALRDACRNKVWARRLSSGLIVAMLLLIAQESIGHVLYLRFGTDPRTSAREWIETHLSPQQWIGVTPSYHGDWSSVPPLDEHKWHVAVMPLGRSYIAADYKNRELDFVILCDLTLADPQNSAEAANFVRFVQSEENYKLVKTFAPPVESYCVAERLGWQLPFDWRYTRPTFTIYERQQKSSVADQAP